jgi:enoyl-CoA hydratase/carnithine racemase
VTESWSLREAASRLAGPWAVEELSILGRPEPLVVRYDADLRVDPGWLAARVATAATVTVLWCEGEPAAVPDVLADAFDVCVTGAVAPPAPWVDAPISGVEAAVGKQPLAALALVSLLRAAAGLDVWAGLAAESATYALLLGSSPFAEWRRSEPRRWAPPDLQPVLLEREGEQLRITLNRPGRHNALDTPTRDGLVEALELAAADPTITRVELGGAGSSFCSGGDLDEFGTVGDPAVAHAVRLTRHPGWWMHRLRDRITVRAHGASIGAGIELAAFAGRVVSAPDGVFGLPEVGMGLVPGAGGTVSVPRRIGRQRCAWLALTGERIDAATARDWGLVDAVSAQTAGEGQPG